MNKYIIAIILIFSVNNAFAKKLWDRGFVEPTIGCIAGASVGYLANKDSETETFGVQNDAFYAGVGCIGGAILGELVKRRYRLKYSGTYESEIRGLKKTIREMQVEQAQRGESLDLEANDYLIQKEIVPGKKLSNGDILSPTIKYRLINPGQNLRMGR